MEKQNNIDNLLAKGVVFIIIIMGIIFLLLSFATLIAPAVVLVLFLVNWIRYLAQDRKWRATNFWLSAQEQEQYKKAAYILAQAEDEKEKVQESLAIQGISRNQDGQINQRSYAGKELRGRENTADSLINKYTPVYHELQFRPHERWKKARSHYSKAFGFGLILFILAAGIINSELKDVSGGELSTSTVLETSDSTKTTVQPDVTEQVEKTEPSEQTTESAESPNENSDPESFLKALLTLFGISIGFMAGILGVLAIIWFIGWLIGRIRFGRKNPEPPTVSMNNVDTYIEAYREKKARKEQERLQRKKEQKQKREEKRQAIEQAKAEKNRIEEKRPEETETQRDMPEVISDVPVAKPETASAVPVENNTQGRSKEENLFISWADSLRNEGYDITGNWENWEYSGPWKNLAVVSSVNGVGVRIAIEYYVKSKKVYFGIAKLNAEDENSQGLLNSETFQNIIRENGLTVKNNETWYCLKFSTFSKAFQEYRHLIETINETQS